MSVIALKPGNGGPLQCCGVISLQLVKINEKKKTLETKRKDTPHTAQNACMLRFKGEICILFQIGLNMCFSSISH